MTSLLLDETEDIAIINNSFQLVTGEEEVAQKIKTVLRTLKGECFLNTAKGMSGFLPAFFTAFRVSCRAASIAFSVSFPSTE